MITLSEDVLEALTGSREGEKIEASAWYGGRLVAQDLVASSWSMTDDATRQVRRELSLQIEDPAGDLIPLGYEDPLSACGQRLAVRHIMPGGERVELGTFLITKSKPAASWTVSQRGADRQLICAGASITVTAADLTAVVKADGLAAPQSPPGSVSAVSEIQRLLSGIIPVVIGKGVDVDRRVSPLMVYDKGQGTRMDAAEDLADTLGAVIRMGSDGAAYVEVPGTDPVWTINGGDDGVLIGVDFEHSIDKLYNECISSSSGGDTEIMGSYRIDTGPLRWGGPLGHRIVFHDNPLITHVEQAVADARTVLTNKVAKRALPITVQCLNHPGLQSSDPVRIEMPTCHGFRAVTGAVASISRRGTTAGVSQMEVVVNVTMGDFVEALRG